MRNLIVTEFVALDGACEAPEKWTSPYWNEEISKFKHDELFASGALLLGRRTYEGFAAAWPSRSDETGFADRMNGLPKHVVSTTLERLEWANSRLINGEVAKAVAELKQQTGQDLLVYGSGALVQSLTDADLVDDYRLIVYPVLLGEGKRLFTGRTHRKLKLAETRPFSSGAVLLRYSRDDTA
jgi:dihydrofolate reductase